jgi:glycerol-3-phosphate acyltransferase PlsY
VFSVYVGFRGGKGVATSAGLFLALAPYAVLIGLVVWATIVFATGYVSLASLAAAVLLPALVFGSLGVGATFWASFALAAFVIFAHRSNIRRLLRGDEHRFRRKAATR